jgi:hypothetical protein
MSFDYQKICSDLIKDLPPRTREVILRRFGLKTGQRETLEAIGRDFGITRERVRQIEEDAINKLKPKTKKIQKVFHYFQKYLKSQGGLKKEDILLKALGGENQRPQVYFLLTLGENFQRFGETADFYSFWLINQDSLNLAKKVIETFYNQLKEIKQPLALKNYKSPVALKRKTLLSYLEISKKIQQNSEGLFGLKDWPEINPRGVKDKAYLVFKKVGKPLHFAEVAKLIEGSLVQTVHNELIKDPRFVLVGRGIYALEEWGYFPGQVKDVILKILKEERRPLTKEEVLEKVRKQRLVKENTVFLNLSNKKYFQRDSQGKYIVREI